MAKPKKKWLSYSTVWRAYEKWQRERDARPATSAPTPTPTSTPPAPTAGQLLLPSLARNDTNAEEGRTDRKAPPDEGSEDIVAMAAQPVRGGAASNTPAVGSCSRLLGSWACTCSRSIVVVRSPTSSRSFAGFEFVTYVRKPYPALAAGLFKRTIVARGESYQVHERRLKNLGKGRGRLRRIALRTPEGRQINLVAISTAPVERLIAIMIGDEDPKAVSGRWVQENAFKHGNERWGINQLDDRFVEQYANAE